MITFFKKFILLFILLGMLVTFFYVDGYQWLSIENLKNQASLIEAWTKAHYFLSVTTYIVIYSLLIACTVPCATLLALIGGLLFGITGVVYACIGTTLGGVLLFFAIRLAVGSHLNTTSRMWIKKLEAGFQRNAFNYLLTLRLIPILPCWISNISAGALNVPLRTFVVATLLGIFPATFVYVMIGRGLDKVFRNNQIPNLNMLLTPELLLPLLGLALLSFIPFIYKLLKKNPLQ